MRIMRSASLRWSLGLLMFLVFGEVLVTRSAFATASTHIWAPSTDVQAYKKWHLTADFYVPTESNSDGSRANTITNAGLTVGILPFKKLNAEVGFDHKSGYGVLDKYPMYFNAKVGIPEDSFGKFFPAVAFGIYDIGTKEDKTDSNVLYGKVAKTFILGGINLGRLSAGYFAGNNKLLVHGGKKDNDGVLLAWERVMSEISDKLWLCVEYQGSRSSYGAMNYGASWKFADNVSVIFGYQIYNDVNLANTFTIQTDIDF
ncbi:MAG: hypothetical protein AAB213_03950 [Candidatus Omnitrophota bacterium]